MSLFFFLIPTINSRGSRLLLRDFTRLFYSFCFKYMRSSLFYM